MAHACAAACVAGCSQLLKASVVFLLLCLVSQEDDYFAKSNEFMAFLQEYRQILFNGGPGPTAAHNWINSNS